MGALAKPSVSGLRKYNSLRTDGRTLSVSQAKTHLLALLNDLQTDPTPITKRGRAVAQLIPVNSTERPSGYASMKGTATIKGDIVSPDHAAWGASDEAIASSQPPPEPWA